MKTTEFKKDHYPLVCRWWMAQGWPAIPFEALSRNGGVAIEHEGRLVCAGWVYNSDSTLGCLEFVVADPEADKEIKDKSLDLLLETLLVRAKEIGIGLLFSSTSHVKLGERYAKHGFQVTDKAMTNFIRRL